MEDEPKEITNSPSQDNNVQKELTKNNDYIPNTEIIQKNISEKNIQQTNQIIDNENISENLPNLNDKNFSKAELRIYIKNIWNEENTISTVDSLYCENVKQENENQINLLKSYEQEIQNLKEELLVKDKELKTYINNLNSLQVNNNSEKINENYINSNKNKEELQIQNLIFFTIFKEYSRNMFRIEEDIEPINQENPDENIYEYKSLLYSKRDNFLIMQKVNELTIIDKDSKSFEKLYLSKEPLNSANSQKLEMLNNSTQFKTKSSIQKLKSFEIISDSIFNDKDILEGQSVNEKNNPSLKKTKKFQQIQEIDGIEIWGDPRNTFPQNKNNYINNIKENVPSNILIKFNKKKLYPEIVDNIEIPREYDMLIAKPNWNSLEIQGSGLYFLSCPKNVLTENNQKINDIDFSNEKFLKNFSLIVPIPENFIDKLDNFEICEEKKAPTSICAENIDVFDISKAYSSRLVINSFGNLQIQNLSICLLGNKILSKNDSNKLFSFQDKKEYNWNEINRPINAIKLIVDPTKINKEYFIETHTLDIISNEIQHLIPETNIEFFISSDKINEKNDIDLNVTNNIFGQNELSIIQKKPKKNIEKIKIIEKPIKSLPYKKENSNEIILKNDWNELFDIEKQQEINYINKKKSATIIIRTNINWNKNNKSQKTIKFDIISSKKQCNLDIDNCVKLFIKKDFSEEESVIYINDYNSNNEEMLKRGIKAKILKVKKEPSLTNSSSDIDVLAPITIHQPIMYNNIKNTFGNGKVVIREIEGKTSVVGRGEELNERKGECIVNGRNVNYMNNLIDFDGRILASYRRTLQPSQNNMRPLEIILNNTRIVNDYNINLNENRESIIINNNSPINTMRKTAKNDVEPQNSKEKYIKNNKNYNNSINKCVDNNKNILVNHNRNNSLNYNSNNSMNNYMSNFLNYNLNNSLNHNKNKSINNNMYSSLNSNINNSLNNNIYNSLNYNLNKSLNYNVNNSLNCNINNSLKSRNIAEILRRHHKNKTEQLNPDFILRKGKKSKKTEQLRDFNSLNNF